MLNNFFKSPKHHLALELTNELTRECSWLMNGYLFWNCYLSFRVALIFTKIPKELYSKK